MMMIIIKIIFSRTHALPPWIITSDLTVHKHKSIAKKKQQLTSVHKCLRCFDSLKIRSFLFIKADLYDRQFDIHHKLNVKEAICKWILKINIPVFHNIFNTWSTSHRFICLVPILLTHRDSNMLIKEIQIPYIKCF